MRNRLASREGDEMLPPTLRPEGERGPYRTPPTRFGRALAEPERERAGVPWREAERGGKVDSTGEKELSEGEDSTASRSDSSSPDTG